MFNKDFGLYVRVDDLEELPDGGKLLLTRTRHELNPAPQSLQTSLSTADAVPVLSQRSLSVSDSQHQAQTSVDGPSFLGSSDT